jgi:hypothetical protein
MKKTEIQVLIQRYCIACSGFDMAQAQGCGEECPLRGIGWANEEHIAKSELIARMVGNCERCVEDNDKCDTRCVLTPVWDSEILPI